MPSRQHAGSCGVPGVSFSVPETPFWNAFVLALPCSSARLVETARQRRMHLGVDVSSRLPGSGGNHLLCRSRISRSQSILNGSSPLCRGHRYG